LTVNPGCALAEEAGGMYVAPEVPATAFPQFGQNCASTCVPQFEQYGIVLSF